MSTDPESTAQARSPVQPPTARPAPANRTVGIDLASQPTKTAACVIDWSGQGAVAWFERDVTDAGLLTLMSSAAKVGVDCPLGWPADFVAAVSAHTRGESWPGAEQPGSEALRRLRFRETDRQIAAQVGGRWPLSVSTDLIGIVAIRYARLESQLVAAGIDVNRDGSGLVAETYPAATLRHWGIRSRGYKGATSGEHLPEMVDQLLVLMPWLRFANEDAASECRRSHDAFDALICALIARAVLRGESTAPTSPQDRRLASVEGWIHIPTESAATLLHG